MLTPKQKLNLGASLSVNICNTFHPVVQVPNFKLILTLLWYFTSNPATEPFGSSFRTHPKPTQWSSRLSPPSTSGLQHSTWTIVPYWFSAFIIAPSPNSSYNEPPWIIYQIICFLCSKPNNFPSQEKKMKVFTVTYKAQNARFLLSSLLSSSTTVCLHYCGLITAATCYPLSSLPEQTSIPGPVHLLLLLSGSQVDADVIASN